MTALVSLLPIFGYATIFYIYFRKSVSVSIFFSISFIITMIYIFGMFDILKYGTYLVFYAGTGLFLFSSLKYKSQMLLALTSVPFVMYTLSSIVYLYLMKDAQLFFWDEYSHWGAFIKEMYYFHQFYDASSVAANLSYPPGISIWDYFIVLPIGFTEGSIYFAYFLILFSSTLMMYEKLSFKQIHWIVLVFSIQMVLFANFGHGFSSIYVDHIVGAMFAGLMLSYINDKFLNKEIYLFIFPLIALSLIKEVGFILDFLFLFFIFIIYVVNNSKEKQISYIKSIKGNKKILLAIIFLFILLFIAFKSWTMRQEANGIVKNGITMSKIVDNLSKDTDAEAKKIQDEIHNRFFEIFTSQQISKNMNSLNYNEFSYSIMHTYKDTMKLSGFGIFIFMLLFSMFIYYGTNNVTKRKDIFLINSFLIIIFCIHVSLLYVSYLNGFGGDGLRIPSYVRYINTIILPILAIQFSLLLPTFQGRSYSMKQFNIAFFVLIVLIAITKPYLKPLYSQLENGFRKNVDVATKNILDNVPQKKKIFVVFLVKNNGSLNNILRYSLIPARATISENAFADYTSQQMIEIFSKYDYVWFASINQDIINKNKVFLKAKNETNIFVLYKVNIVDNSIQFIPVI